MDIQPNVQHLSSISYTYAGSTSGALSNTYVDDTNYHQVNAKSRFVPPYYNYYRLNIGFNFDPSLGGRDLFVSAKIVTSIGAYLSINGIVVYSGTTIDFDDVLFEDVTSITLHTYEGSVYHNAKIYFFEIKDPDLGLDDEKDNATPYSLDIPQIGRVYDAELNVAFQSCGTLTGDGNCSLLLVKDYLNATLDDTILTQTIESYEAQQPFSYTLSLDLSLYLNQGIISEYYGTYTLYIGIYGTDRNDCFNLTRFEISTNTYVTAGFDDTEGWVTDPGEEDSDFDGWDDFYEIFTSETNPVSKDMDGDEAWDPNDRDPYGDLMLDIQPYYSAFRNILAWESHPWMQIAITFTMGDDEYYFNTPDARANTELWYDWGDKYHAVYYDDIHYYVNVDDDKNRQDDELIVGLKLWQRRWGLGLDPPWDALVVDGSDTYTIGEPGDPYDTLHAQQVGPFEGINELDVKIRPISVDRANTIAVYETGGTFNGHYNEKEQRFNVIQLNVLGESYYPATYDFQQSLDGWTDESGNGCSANCTGMYEDHSGVIHLSDRSDNSACIQLLLGSAKSNDIEFWVYPDTSGRSAFTLYSGDSRILYIGFYAYSGTDYIKCVVGSNYYTLLTGYTEKWYHFRLDLNFATHKWNCYIDQELKLGNINFESSVGSYNKIRYNTYSSGDFSQGDTYFDSLGLIGYNGYAQGDNLETYSCDGTPFVEGPNAIVIPTSLFTRTELHHYIENDQLEETPLYSAVDGLFEMISIERDENPDKACGDVDYVFIRYDISPEDAMAVLNMVLQGMIEETLDENNNTMYLNGTVNEYLSSKLDGIRATLLNLPYASLGYIPWTMPYVNSPTGPQPHPADPWGVFIWVITWIIPILHVIVFAVVNMLASDTTGFMANFAKSIFMKLMTALGNLLWLIIRAAILVFAWLIFAINLPFVILGFLTAVTGLYWILTFKSIDCSISFNSITLNTETYTIMVGYECNLVYVDFFDLEIPSIDLFYKKDNVICLNVPNNIYNVGLNPLNNDNFNSIINPVMISSQPNSSDENTLIAFLNGCGATMGLIGSGVGVLAAIWTLLDTFKDCALLYLSFNLLCGSFSFFVYALANSMSINTLGGMIAGIGLGLIISSLFGLFIATCTFSKFNPLSYIGLGVSVFSLTLSFIEGVFSNIALPIESTQIFLGIATLLIGTFIATSLGTINEQKQTLLGAAIFVLGLISGLVYSVLGVIFMCLNI